MQHYISDETVYAQSIVDKLNPHKAFRLDLIIQK